MNIYNRKKSKTIIKQIKEDIYLKKVFCYLKKANWSLCSAESCTGGLFSAAITSRSGASDLFKGGINAYSNDVKVSVLGIDKKIVESFGAVSEKTVKEMAKKSVKLFNADVSVAITGIAGPSGGTEEKPVGTVWICINAGEKIEAFRFHFLGNRKRVRLYTVRMSIYLLSNFLKESLASS
ncbi:MAG: CinA family protein [Candidatus Aureabacteria bacterium]|nr:CinA family protein [Candidatus Auribacterota bacterium]